MEKQKLIAVVGATASGKTALAIAIAKAVGGEVVSCDSMQIYKNMTVATAAPTQAEMRGIPHHMVAILEPTVRFSVADYCDMANKCISDIASRGAVPVLCGGTGLYYSSLVDGIEFSDISFLPEIRAQLEEEYDAVGGVAMLERMHGFDIESADKLKPADKKRIVRAFEVYRATGVSQSEHNRLSRGKGSRFELLSIGIDYADRNILYERINNRVDIMLKNGIIEEAQSFFERYQPDSTAAQAIGYKELRPWLDGLISLDEAVETLKRETRHYAKRQLSWFRRDDRICWLCADQYDGWEQLAADAAAKAREFIYGNK